MPIDTQKRTCLITNRINHAYNWSQRYNISTLVDTLATDARGYEFKGKPDIGDYEYNGIAPTP